MAKRDGEMPAWMVCDSIVSKARDELLSQAVSLMHKQIDKKRISLEGQILKLDEVGDEQAKDVFLLTQLVKEHENIERRFGSYIREAQLSGNRLERAEELERFLLELRQILLLYEYSKACEAWLVEVEKELGERSPEGILVKTAKKKPQTRGNVLEYLLKDDAMVKDGVFSGEERKVMGGALRGIRG